MEEVETDQAVILECCHEEEDRRRKILSVPVHDWRKKREIFNTWSWEKKLDENNQPIDEDDITV